MSDGIYCALSGAIAQQRSLEVVGNNVANAGAVGFRGDNVAFREVLTRTQTPAGPAKSLHYAVVSKVQTDDSQGGLRQTGNPLDVALQGDGYFAVETPQGERYTRAGSFLLDAQGVLRNSDGLSVLSGTGDKGQRVSIPAETTTIEISPDGTINADGNEIGKLRIVRFDDPTTLLREGSSLFSAPAGTAPLTDDKTEVAQGYLETANINAVSSLNELVNVNRSFEAFQKVMRAYGDLDTRTARELGNTG
jgi:flagellar basal-body rod protein FlgF